MEENTAILMADLSGYTALTEIHGSSSAADLIERYMEIVKTCLAGDSHLHERTGDEVLILSSSADHLLETAVLLLQASHKEDGFLRLHGGLHYGKLLKRSNSYFGTAINLTSRIVSKARTGSIWCSRDFVDALSGATLSSFRSMGNHGFKNLTEATELFEVVLEEQSFFHVDPVCRMLILDVQKAIPHPSSPEIFFCSQDCLEAHVKKATPDLQQD
jgi:adenylate cyclase